MYTLSKGPRPNKFGAGARRGPPRQRDFEGYDTREKSIKSFKNGADDLTTEMSASGPRPTFTQKRPLNNRKPPPSSNQESYFSENHLDMAELLSKQWKKVQDGRRTNKDGESLYEVYLEKEPCKDLDDFQPFDLEKFWGHRTLNNVLGKPTS